MRILAIRPRALGDVVLVTPALRALRRGHLGAVIDVITEPRYACLIEGLEGVARVWPLERSAAATLRLILELRRQSYDLAVDFFGNPRTALITGACGAKRTAGYQLRGRGRAFDIRVPRTLEMASASGMRREYAAATHVRLAQAVGGVADGLDARIAMPHAAQQSALRWLETAGVRDAKRTVGLVPAGSWSTKAWPAANAGRLAKRIMDRGREVLLLTGPGEDEIARTVLRHAPGACLLPPCGVGDLAAVISRLGAVVGVDSGPKHMAAALGVPTVTWYGPTHPDTWSPPAGPHSTWWTSLPCRGCDRTACPHWNCMPSLTPEHAAGLVIDHLELHERNAADFHSAARA